MKKIYFLVMMVIIFNLNSYSQVTIGIQDFEASPASPTLTFTTSNIGSPGTSTGFSSGASGAGDAPASTNLYASGARGYRVQGPASGSATTAQTLTFSSVNTSSYSAISLSFKVAGMSLGSTGNGMDNTTGTTILGTTTPVDFALVEVSPDGGVNWYQQAIVAVSNGNVRWSFAPTGSGTRGYAANNSYSTYLTTGTGTITSGTTAVTTSTVTGLPAVANLQIRITLECNSANESWIIDDVKIEGISGACSGAPTGQASFLSTTPVSTSANINLTAGTGGVGRIVKINTTNSFTNLNDGDNPSPVFTTYSGGEQVIYNGTGTGPINVAGLTASTTYYLAVYEYNCAVGRFYFMSGGSPGTTNFMTTAPPVEGLQLSTANTNYIIDFDNTVANVNNGQFNGTGFTTSPAVGQLNSNAWATEGMSDGDGFLEVQILLVIFLEAFQQAQLVLEAIMPLLLVQVIMLLESNPVQMTGLPETLL